MYDWAWLGEIGFYVMGLMGMFRIRRYVNRQNLMNGITSKISFDYD